MEDGWRDPLANYIRVCILTQVCSLGRSGCDLQLQLSLGCAICSCAAPVQPGPALCFSWSCSYS